MKEESEDVIPAGPAGCLVWVNYAVPITAQLEPEADPQAPIHGTLKLTAIQARSKAHIIFEYDPHAPTRRRHDDNSS